MLPEAAFKVVPSMCKFRKALKLWSKVVQQNYTVAYNDAIAGHDQERCKQLLVDHGETQKRQAIYEMDTATSLWLIEQGICMIAYFA